VRLTFLGGAGTVTGSKYLVEAGGRRVLVDCGLFQGLKELRLLNWARLPVDPASIDAVVLTHAHLDHSGYLPLLVRNGFRGPVHCTPPTSDLCAILLPDSGYLQEKEAEYANRHGFSKHRPALPLYTAQEAIASLDRFEPKRVGHAFDVVAGVTAHLRPAGHILGAATVELSADGRTIVFSGDLGRTGSPTMPDPEPVHAADYVVVESTYGDRMHDATDPEDVLAEIIVRTAGRGGSVLMPIFAVGRIQTILHHIRRLKIAGRIPDLPVFVDSPMASAASKVFANHLGAHRFDAKQCVELAAAARYVDSVEESKRLGESRVPRIILSASGMATGGRVLHHLKVLAPDPANTILFAGYQAAGTRGAAMVAGARSVKIHGAQVTVAAEVANLGMLSAHADREEILSWLSKFERPPRHCFVTHGEPPASEALRADIERRLGWKCSVPQAGAVADLG